MDKIADAIALIIMKGTSSPGLAYTYFAVDVVRDLLFAGMVLTLIWLAYSFGVRTVNYHYGPRPIRQNCHHCGRVQ